MRELILDTNVLVAGLQSKRGASYQLIGGPGSSEVTDADARGCMTATAAKI
jgi:predicted nucleic acid-binding protein